jgi:hypothetical protein
LKLFRYEAPLEVGANSIIEMINFEVIDKEGNRVKDQIFTIQIEPIDNQPPVIEFLNGDSLKVIEGGYVLLSDVQINIKDSDTSREHISIIIDSPPHHGRIENIEKGNNYFIWLKLRSLINYINTNNIR